MTSIIGKQNRCSEIFFFFCNLRSETLLKKRLQHRCFTVNFAKFLRTFFFIEHLLSLLLKSGTSANACFWMYCMNDQNLLTKYFVQNLFHAF